MTELFHCADTGLNCFTVYIHMTELFHCADTGLNCFTAYTGLNCFTVHTQDCNVSLCRHMAELFHLVYGAELLHGVYTQN